MNVGGLASGLDTNSIIAQLMDVERIPIKQLETRKAGYEAKDKAWQQIDTRFAAIRTALDKVRTTADLNAFVATSTSDSAVATATAGDGASAGSVTFTVNRLAAAHQVVSTTTFAAGTDLVGAGDFTITVNGTPTTVTADVTTTVSDLAQKINAAGAGVTASVLQIDPSTVKLALTADATGAAQAFTTSSTITSLATTDVVQQGVDAQLTIGSGTGALTLTRSTNSITDLLPGVTIDLAGTSTTPVTIGVSRDVTAATDAIAGLVDEVNTTLTTLDSYMSYDADTNTAGELLGDSTARSLADRLRSSITGSVRSGATYPTASSIGISLNRNGTFDVDQTKLQAALENDFDGVVDLLVAKGSTTDSRASFVRASSATADGTYAVQITQAATAPSALSAVYAPPAATTTFQISVGATTANVTVNAGDGITAAVAAINSALTAAGVTSVTASEVQTGGNSYIELDHAGYGSSATFTVTGDPFGLAGTYTGTDVAGTIGGQAATGSGRTLTAGAGAPNGLVVEVTATPAEVSAAGGTLALGDVTYAAGAFGALDAVVDEARGSLGTIATAQEQWQSQIDYIDERISEMNDRLDQKEQLLRRQFTALETAMSKLTAQSSWLTAQLGSLSAGQ